MTANKKHSSADIIEPLEIEETSEDEIEVVDIGDVSEKEVDLNLGDEPFEIDMDTVEKMRSAASADSTDNTEAGGSTDVPKKDVMLKSFDDIYESFTKDSTKKIILITALIALVGSFFEFCSIKSADDISRQIVGIFFSGFSVSLISSILSKVCIIAIIAATALVMVNLKLWSSRVMLVVVLTYIIQCVLFVVLGSMYYAVPMNTFRPGIGFFITAAAILVMWFFVHKNKVTVRLYQ